MKHDSIPGYKWLGYQDSRKYLGDNDDDYNLKHFFLKLEDNELSLSITNETMGEKNGQGGFYEQGEGECNWPCYSQVDAEVLEKILMKSIGTLHLPTER